MREGAARGFSIDPLRRVHHVFGRVFDELEHEISADQEIKSKRVHTASAASPLEAICHGFDAAELPSLIKDSTHISALEKTLALPL
jgi:hypothetical protein